MKSLIPRLFLLLLLFVGFAPAYISSWSVTLEYALAEHCADEVACPSDTAEVHQCYPFVSGNVCDGTNYGLPAGTCDPKKGNSCTSLPNACGDTTPGGILCDGTCSASTPATPYTVGAACNRNACGGTGTITDACTGACSAAAPAPCPPPAADTTAPTLSQVTAVSSPTNNTTPNYTFSSTEAGTITYGGDCSSSTTAAATGNNTVTFNALAQGVHTNCTIKVTDAANNQSAALGVNSFTIDTTVPTTFFADLGTTPAGVTPAPGSLQDSTFTVSVSDADTGGSGLSTCHYGVYSDPTGWTVPLGTARTCNSNLSITVGAAGDCRNTGTNICQVQTYSRDAAGNQSPIAMRAFSIQFLTYPTGTWQRLWYATSGASPGFTSASFLGETPNEASEKFSTDWGAGVLAYARVDSIGFKSSRTINFPTAGTFRFTIGSDDGARLFIDGTNHIDQWLDGSYRTAFKDIALSAGDHQFELDFYENGGNAMASFTYGPPPCLKSTDLSLQWDTNVPISGSQCTVTVKHVGFDRTDFSAVSMETQNKSIGYRKVAIDDNPASGCENNFSWETRWGNGPVGSNFFVYSTGIAKDTATNKVEYGYEVTSSNCVVQSNTPQCLAGPCSTFASVPLDDRSIKTTVTCNDGAPNCAFLADISFRNDLTFVECTANSHCTADPNKAKCNLGTTTNFPQNTCIDSVAPTSTIESEAGFSVVGSTRTLTQKASDGTYWLKDDTYSISITDSDNVGGSGIDPTYCLYQVIDIGRGKTTSYTRFCSFPVSMKVGPKGDSTADCLSEGLGKCQIWVRVKDMAGNEQWTQKIPNLNIDLTPPTAQ